MNASVNQIHSTVISNIRRIRKQKGYTQEYMGIKMNVSQNTFSKMELGLVELSVVRFLQIAQILQVDSNTFFKAYERPLIMESANPLNQGFAKKAIHKLVAPYPGGLAALMNRSA